MNHNIRFLFDYNCTPIWLSDDNCGDWLISSKGYFYNYFVNTKGEEFERKVPEYRLKGEFELEIKVKLIYEIHNRLFDINQFPNGNPYLGFTDKTEEINFFDACDYVIKRMREIFGLDFTVNEDDEKVIKERSQPN